MPRTGLATKKFARGEAALVAGATYLLQDGAPTLQKGTPSLDDISLGALYFMLLVLLTLSAFFSSSETGMMSLNRYRLRHLVKNKHRGATLASKLLARTDRLIGVILIGNNLVNVWATAIATVIGARLYGDAGVVIATTLLTLGLLIFAEATPKTIAANFPERIAFPAAYVLRPLLLILYPVVLLVNSVSNIILYCLGIRQDSKTSLTDHLHPEELRTVVDEAGDLIPDQHQGMLLGVLDLEKATVEDIMVPRHEVVGIDLEDDIPTILELVRTTDYTRLPVYDGDINEIVGVLHLRNAARFLRGQDSEVTHESIRKQMYSPYFVPEATPLTTQLMNFQKEKRRFGIVVDEYGDIKGLVTLVDLLEEIVGDFSSDTNTKEEEEIQALDDGWYSIDASAFVRDVNRHLGWRLPTNGPKTINGMIVEHLENIPEALCALDLEDYRIEIAELGDNRIQSARIKELSVASL